MDFIKTTLNEDNWNIFLIEDDDEVLSDSETAAEVHFADKEIYFKRSLVTLQIVLHEMWHVYFGYCYLSDTNDLSLDDIEEISAALFSDKAEKIISRGKEIYKRLIELKENNEKAKST
jgi:hypothetical protein